MGYEQLLPAPYRLSLTDRTSVYNTAIHDGYGPKFAEHVVDVAVDICKREGEPERLYRLYTRAVDIAIDEGC